MSWWEAAVLGLVQGLAEFLPISSSGHLVLGQYLLGIDEPDITFEVFVHFGTTLSIVTVYWGRILRILRDGFGALARPAAWREALRPGRIERARGDEIEYEPQPSGGPVPSLRLILYVLLTMIPTGLAYVLFEEPLEAAFSDPRLVCGMLLVTGTLLLLTRLRPTPDGVLSPVKALVVGAAQAFALIPGISRSGSTICTAIYLNVDRKEAADFSFLMLLPVVLGATLLKVLEMAETGLSGSALALGLGTLVAYVSGIVAIRAVVILVQRRSLQYFAFYCFAV
ncbi:MAG TPA: undecaprenyl-diphosphate phosphatase, partial [Rubricoccaceae bacterium]|nr:undecaprenyl-diphosphate phosphatase [Rubricoccaceae bacterium]